MSTKESILDTSLRLFNEHGTKAISTNHIAEAMGISPGNLYYHFANKEAIVRTLAERLGIQTSRAFDPPVDRPLGLTDLVRMVRRNFEVAWEYRFFYRELIALLNADPELKSAFLAERRRAFGEFRPLFDAFVAAGVLRSPDDPAEIEQVAELAWMVTEFWLPAVELGGREVTERELERGTALLMHVLRPYLVNPSPEGDKTTRKKGNS